MFDSVSVGANIPFQPLTLIYAENGRGKTTLVAILRSLATGDPIPIAERHRLAAQHPPHVVVECDGGPAAAMFQNNVWNRTLPNMAVFDDVFVDENIYSGLVVDAEHRQRLHELILGAQGVALNERLQQLVSDIEGHNTAIRNKAAAIPALERGPFPVAEFCALPARPNIDAEIQGAERSRAAALEQDRINNTSLFDALSLPGFDVGSIGGVLQEDLPSLDAVAAARVQNHVASLGHGSEAWLADGMRRVPEVPAGAAVVTCPFCAQDLAGSAVITHYRAYFSDAYAELKRTVAGALAAINHTHGDEVPAAFERAVRKAVERRAFWSQFCDVPEVTLDTASIARDWRTAREAVVAALTEKEAAPLERIALSNEAQAAVTGYETHRQTVGTLDERLRQANVAIRVVQEQAATGNPAALAGDLARLRAVKARHTLATAALCSDYLAEAAAKATTEHARDQTRAALDQHRANVFRGYQTAINLYLQLFNADFRLGSVTFANTRAGSACNYDVIINNTPVQVGGSTRSPGEPSFRNTLSAGDRNTLALAFFFASLDQDQVLADKIVIVDDPISSLDEHRALTTVQEMRRLVDRVAQVVILSHDKRFLCRIWEGADPTSRSALLVARDGAGSTLRGWDVNEDSATEHDRRHSLLREYLVTSTPNNREVARSIRPHLEAFVRVAYPEHFPSGTLLGPFRALCGQRVGTPQQILNADDTQELHDMAEYANRFHHDTNPAWETETINDTELAGFVRRALAFAKR